MGAWPCHTSPTRIAPDTSRARLGAPQAPRESLRISTAPPRRSRRRRCGRRHCYRRHCCRCYRRRRVVHASIRTEPRLGLPARRCRRCLKDLSCRSVAMSAARMAALLAATRPVACCRQCGRRFGLRRRLPARAASGAHAAALEARLRMRSAQLRVCPPARGPLSTRPGRKPEESASTCTGVLCLRRMPSLLYGAHELRTAQPLHTTDARMHSARCRRMHAAPLACASSAV